MSSTTYTTGRLGEILQVSADTVRRHWPAWHRAQGFPKPLPLPTDNARALLRWDAAAVDAWRSHRGGNGDGGPADAVSIDTTDWAAVARARGLALDRGENPDAVFA